MEPYYCTPDRQIEPYYCTPDQPIDPYYYTLELQIEPCEQAFDYTIKQVRISRKSEEKKKIERENKIIKDIKEKVKDVLDKSCLRDILTILKACQNFKPIDANNREITHERITEQLTVAILVLYIKYYADTPNRNKEFYRFVAYCLQDDNEYKEEIKKQQEKFQKEGYQIENQHKSMHKVLKEKCKFG